MVRSHIEVFDLCLLKICSEELTDFPRFIFVPVKFYTKCIYCKRLSLL